MHKRATYSTRRGSAVSLLPTLADRVWFAYHCLPRDENGYPPPYISLERPWKLPNNTLSRVVSGERKELWASTLASIAKALGVTMDWLQNGGAERPTPTGIVPPRPNGPPRKRWPSRVGEN